jgi:hypothetical protein
VRARLKSHGLSDAEINAALLATPARAAKAKTPPAPLPADVLARLRAKGFTDDEIRAAQNLPTAHRLDD